MLWSQRLLPPSAVVQRMLFWCRAHRPAWNAYASSRTRAAGVLLRPPLPCSSARRLIRPTMIAADMSNLVPLKGKCVVLYTSSASNQLFEVLRTPRNRTALWHALQSPRVASPASKRARSLPCGRAPGDRLRGASWRRRYRGGMSITLRLMALKMPTSGGRCGSSATKEHTRKSFCQKKVRSMGSDSSAAWTRFRRCSRARRARRLCSPHPPRHVHFARSPATRALRRGCLAMLYWLLFAVDRRWQIRDHVWRVQKVMRPLKGRSRIPVGCECVSCRALCDADGAGAWQAFALPAPAAAAAHTACARVPRRSRRPQTLDRRGPCCACVEAVRECRVVACPRLSTSRADSLGRGP